jgi:hypothetical protein
LHFPSGQVAHYNKTTLKNLCIFHHFKIFVFFTWAGRPLQQDHFEESLHFSLFWEILAFLTTLINLCIFHLGRSPITTRPLWKIFVFFITLKSSCFSPGQVAHYNKTTLKNLCIFHYFEKFLHFSPLW